MDYKEKLAKANEILKTRVIDVCDAIIKQNEKIDVSLTGKINEETSCLGGEINKENGEIEFNKNIFPEEKKGIGKAEKMLCETINTLQDRNDSYGHPQECFDKIAKRWSLTVGHIVTPQMVAMMMIDLKLVRLSQNNDCKDSALDIAGYAGCLAEVQNG